jgi:hypothetical protein
VILPPLVFPGLTIPQKGSEFFPPKKFAPKTSRQKIRAKKLPAKNDLFYQENLIRLERN